MVCCYIVVAALLFLFLVFQVTPNGNANPYVPYNLNDVGNLFASVIYQMAIDPISSYASVKGYARLQTINYDFMRFGNGHEVLANSMIAGYNISVRRICTGVA